MNWFKEKWLAAIAAISQYVRDLPVKIGALLLALGSGQTPWFAWAIVVTVLAYAISPIDLIPDIIPIFGLLDDVILIPAGVYMAGRLMPSGVMAGYEDMARRTAKRSKGPRLLRLWGAVMIVFIWLLVAYAVWTYLIATS